jgi:hypothetical protein
MAHTPDAAEPLGAYLHRLRTQDGDPSVQRMTDGRWAGVRPFTQGVDERHVGR